MHPKHHLTILASMLLLLLIVHPLTAQDSSGERTGTQAWLKMGIGHSGTKNFVGIIGMVSAHYVSRYGIIGLRYIASDRTGADPGIPYGNRVMGINELSMSWGYSSNISFLSLSASAGLGSFLWRETQKRDRMLSVPLEAQILIKPVRFVGIGAMLSTSLNKESTLTSGMVILQIGNFK